MLAAHHRPLEEEPCPISDQFLGELYRSDLRNIDLLIASIDPGVRAMLALFCYRRSHLAPVGLAVAASCNEEDLTHWGGIGGAALFAASRQAPVQIGVRSTGRPKITLSSGTFSVLSNDLSQDEPDEPF